MKITITQGIDPMYYEKQTSQANESDSASDATAVSSATGSTTSTATNADGMTFAETLQAIDQAIADAKANGQSGLDPNSAAAKALGIMAYSTSYAYASLVNNTSASTTYNEALTTLTNRYSNYSREDMGYKGDSASDYGGDLACSDELNAYFDEAAKTYNVDVKLLKSVAKAESGFNASAVSSAGAVGIMQLMPSTASGLGVTDSYDAYQNIMGGAKYLAALLDTFNGNASYAVAGYNAGGSKVTQYGGIPPYAETQKYVVKVLGYYEGVSYSADATSAGSYSTISASGSESSTSSSSTSSSSLTAEEIQDMIEKAVSSALESALSSTISDALASAISSSVSSTIQSAVESSMSEIATETIGEWLNTEVEKTMREILAEQEAAATDDTTTTEDTSSEEVTTSAIEDVPVTAPLATEEEETEDSLAINAVTGTETGTSSGAGAEAGSNGSQQ